MSKLIKMELYKLKTSKLFIVLLIVFAVTNLILTVAGSVLTDALTNGSMTMQLSGAISSPFNFEILLMFVFISAVSFFYLDFSDGYIKNIAGQLPNRGGIVTAKFIAVAVHNLIFFILGMLSNLLGGAVTGGIVADAENIWAGIATFFIKWLLSLAICAILMFFAVGLKSKTFALVLGVMIPLGAFSLLYMGIDAGIENLFKVENFTVKDYMPDTLIGSVDAVNNNLVTNSIIAAIVFIAIFYILTYLTFKKRDIK